MMHLVCHLAGYLGIRQLDHVIGIGEQGCQRLWLCLYVGLKLLGLGDRIHMVRLYVLDQGAVQSAFVSPDNFQAKPLSFLARSKNNQRFTT